MVKNGGYTTLESVVVFYYPGDTYLYDTHGNKVTFNVAKEVAYKYPTVIKSSLGDASWMLEPGYTLEVDVTDNAINYYLAIGSTTFKATDPDVPLAVTNL